MKLLVGLGNPEEKYAKNRHNIGFWLVDSVASEMEVGNFSQKFSGLVAKGALGGESVILLKPQAFMNLSGQSVRAALDFYKLTPADVWVVHDDLDLAPLKVRVKIGGSDGGHNGLKSITQHLGTADYHRFRIGIGRPSSKARVNNYVLSDFSKAEAPLFGELCTYFAKKMPVVLGGRGNDAVAQWAQGFEDRTQEPKGLLDKVLSKFK